MSPEATVVLHPEVLEFVTAVRAQLADLDVEEQREILDGLEADLNELVTEQGTAALGDPVGYARELRLAAGLTDPVEARRRTRSVREALVGVLDASADRAGAVLERLPAETAPLVSWLRPVWWIARAWVAVELGNLATGWGLLPLLVAVPISVQLGRGRLWPRGEHSRGPGGEPGLAARVVVLLLNVFAIAMIPVAAASASNAYGDDYDSAYSDGYADGQAGPYVDETTSSLTANGRPVANVYPYDAQGRPLTGVQLFDQDGKPLSVSGRPTCPSFDEVPTVEVPLDPEEQISTCADYDGNAVLGRVFYPWTNGQAQVLNAFPVPSRMQSGTAPSATAYSEKDRPTYLPFPLAQVPRITLPGTPPAAR
jgi:hypothetical protein